MKYRSPSCSYTSGLPDHLEVEADVLGRVLGIGEHEDAVVEHDHASVVRRHDLLEVVLAEVGPAEGVGDLLEVEVDLPDAVDPDHRGQLADRDVRLVGHHLGDHVADLVVHQRHAGLVGGRAVRVELGHETISLGISSVRSSSRSAIRVRERSSESSKRTAFSDTWDQIGWSCRAAARLTGVHSASHCCMSARFAAPCSGSSASIRNSARAPRCSRAVSASPAPITVGVTKSPCSAAACITNALRNSSPTSGSKTTAVAKKACAQSRIPVSRSTFSRVPCQIASCCQTSLWADPSKPSICSEISRL